MGFLCDFLIVQNTLLLKVLGKSSYSFSCRRSLIRGTSILLALLVTVILMILGSAYFFLIQRDNRFAGYQERSDQAWYLAKAGHEYYTFYCAGGQDASLLKYAQGNTLKTYQKGANGAKIWARVPVPKDSTTHYFEIADYGRNRIVCTGNVVGTFAFSKDPPKISRSIVLPKGKAGESYDTSLDL